MAAVVIRDVFKLSLFSTRCTSALLSRDAMGMLKQLVSVVTLGTSYAPPPPTPVSILFSATPRGLASVARDRLRVARDVE